MQNVHLGSGVNSDPFVYTKEQVYEKTLPYFDNDRLRADVWIDKYCLKNSQGEYLEQSPDNMFKRLAKEFERIEQKYPNSLSYEDIYQLLKNFKYIIPGGSILYGVGNNHSISSLGNCFVIGNTSDSYGGICTTDQEQAQLMKRRAGVGHDLSHIRSTNSFVSNSAGTSTGVISFMGRYSHTTREVAQDGRRGALMLSIDTNHPDIEDFITSKDDLSQITGANISVKIDDEFMKAVENDENYYLSFKYSDFSQEKLAFYYNNVEIKGELLFEHNIFPIKAKELWNKIIHQAWKTAEPKLWDLAA